MLRITLKLGGMLVKPLYLKGLLLCLELLSFWLTKVKTTRINH